MSSRSRLIVVLWLVDSGGGAVACNLRPCIVLASVLSPASMGSDCTAFTPTPLKMISSGAIDFASGSDWIALPLSTIGVKGAKGGPP